MGITLEQQHMLAVVSEQGVAVGVAGVGASRVPGLAVEDDDTAGRRLRLYHVLDLHALRRLHQTTMVGAWDDTSASVGSAEVAQQPHRVHHDRRIHV